MDFIEFKKIYEHKKVEEYKPIERVTPLVSVCVQTYQHANYIKECLNGILMQKTSFSFEVLLGEDNSTDGTREICIEYAEKYPDKIRLFLHHRQNNIKIGGKSTGRFNFLYNLYCSQGKYIAICEGDDYWIDENKLQKQVDFLEKDQTYIMCFTNRLVLNEFTSKFESESILKLGKDSFDHGDTPFLAPTLTRVFRNEYLHNSLIIEAPGIDTYLLILQSKFGNIKFINEITSVYRKHEKGIYSSKSLEEKQVHLINTRLHSMPIVESSHLLHFYRIIFELILDLKRRKSKQVWVSLKKLYSVHKVVGTKINLLNRARIYELLFLFIFTRVTGYYSFKRIINRRITKLK